MTELPQQKKSFFRREFIYLLVAVTAVAILGIGIVLQLNPQPTKLQSADYIEGLPKDKVTVGILSEISGLYPKIPFDVDSFSMNNNVFEGLTILRNGKLQPALAESWTNPDNLTWRVKLRKGVKFHSGNAFTARDVKYTIEGAKKKENQGWMSSFMASRVDSVEVIDDQTIELKTKNPDPTLLYWLAYVFILSEDQVKKDGLEKAVGTGPYKRVSINENEFVMSANDGYWAGVPRVKNLIYKAFKDEEVLAQGLETGEADISIFYKKTYNETLKNKGFQIISSRSGNISYLGFDTNSKKAKYVEADKNPFQDVKVRRAIMLALDVNGILKGGDIEGGALTQIGTPELIGFNTQLRRPERNLVEAKKLLAEAGFPDGFTVTLDTFIAAELAGEQIVKQLAEVGIKVKLNAISDYDEFIDKLYGDTSFYYFGYIPDTLDSIDFLNTLVHTKDEKGNGSANFLLYSNAELDSILDKASTIFDTKERAKVTMQAHEKAMNQLPLIPTYTRVGFFAVRNNIAFKPTPFTYIFGFELSGRQKAADATQ